MPKSTAAEHLVETLTDAYKEGKKEAEVFDNLITKLEKRVYELRRKPDKKNVLLKNEVEGMLESAKKLRDACRENGEQKAKKLTEKKRSQKNANLAAGYYLASLRMFQTLAMNDPKNTIYQNQAKGLMAAEYNNLFDEYLKEWKRLTEERYKAFGKSIGIDVKDEDLKSGVGDFEVWDHTKGEKKDENTNTAMTSLDSVFVSGPINAPEDEEDNEPDEDEEDELDEEAKREIRKHIPGMGFGGSGIGF